jgi:hypothetical protein
MCNQRKLPDYRDSTESKHKEERVCSLLKKKKKKRLSKGGLTVVKGQSPEQLSAQLYLASVHLFTK